MVKLIGEVNASGEKLKSERNFNLINFPKILAFPLSSPYISKVLQKMGKTNTNITGLSEDIINFLFENIIYS